MPTVFNFSSRIIFRILIIGLPIALALTFLVFSQQSSELKEGGLDSYLYILESYLSSDKLLSVKLEFVIPLKPDDPQLDLLTDRVVEVALVATIEGQRRGNTVVTVGPRSLQSAIKAFIEAADSMAPILEQTRPDPNIPIPYGKDYVVTKITVRGTANEILQLKHQLSEAKIVDVTKL